MVHVLWRRLDVAGRDACRLSEHAEGYVLDGSAVFFENGAIQCLQYRVTCDRDWRSQVGRVTGWVGGRSVDWLVQQTAAGVWTLNGREHPELNACGDLDVGFTPATNLIQMRRADLQPGQSAEAPAAWLDVEVGTLTYLPQRYARVSADRVHYVSPTAGYEAVLEVMPVGFVRSYPGLWELEHATD